MLFWKYKISSQELVRERRHLFIYFVLVCLFLCLLVSIKRQNGWTDWAQILCWTSHNPREYENTKDYILCNYETNPKKKLHFKPNIRVNYKSLIWHFWLHDFYKWHCTLSIQYLCLGIWKKYDNQKEISPFLYFISKPVSIYKKLGSLFVCQIITQDPREWT